MPGDIPAPPRNRLTQASRLKRAWEFERTRAEGERLAKGCLILNWKLSPALSSPRLGVVTSRKIGGAIVRSRARRLLREVFRLHQRELLPANIVLVARASIVEKEYAQVERDFLVAARQARLTRQWS
jgi:ribonuclease P protein component